MSVQCKSSGTGLLVGGFQQLTLLMLGLLLTTGAQAAATLITPEEIPVLALDQQEIHGNFFRSSKTTYKLDAGTHAIAVRYEQLFNLNSSEDHDILKSAVMTVNATLEDNKRYYLKLVNPPGSYELAKEYVKQPTIALVDEQGKLVAQQQGLNNAPKPVLGSGLFNRIMDFSNETRNSASYATSQQSGTAVKENNSLPSSTIGHVEQLKQLWQQSSKQEREQFIQFIIQ